MPESTHSPARRPGKVTLVLVIALLTGIHILAQQPPIPSVAVLQSAEEPKHKKHKADQDKPAIQPSAVIPVTPLGFAPPANFYLGERIAQLSLNFLDEDTLLFTFRVPGLIPRQRPSSEDSSHQDSAHEETAHDTRNIRALVLALPTGQVTAEAIWQVHDFATYLWPLKDHKFLLRDSNQVQLGDDALRITPFLRFPGRVRYLELDPTNQILVADSVELPSPDPETIPKPEPKSAPQPNPQPAPQSDVSPDPKPDASPEAEPDPKPDADSLLVSGNPPAANPPAHPDPDKQSPIPQNLVRILNMDSRSVLVFTRVDGIVHIAVDGEGYYESLRGTGKSWTIVYTHFNGPVTTLFHLESECTPALDVQAPGVVLASACNIAGGRRLYAIARDQDPEKTRLWDWTIPPTFAWPQLAHAAAGPRFARSTLEVTHPIGPSTPLYSDEIRSQKLDVYDLATGQVPISLRITPIMDGGGNFALSPSGRRLAVLNDGQIQIYDLPAPPPIPAALPQSPASRNSR